MEEPRHRTGVPHFKNRSSRRKAATNSAIRTCFCMIVRRSSAALPLALLDGLLYLLRNQRPIRLGAFRDNKKKLMH